MNPLDSKPARAYFQSVDRLGRVPLLGILGLWLGTALVIGLGFLAVWLLLTYFWAWLVLIALGLLTVLVMGVP